MTAVSQTAFRLPSEALNQQFLKLSAFVALGVVATHFFVSRGGTAALLSSLALLSAILAGCYLVAKRHVWISLSASGFSGMGSTGRTVSISWEEAVTVTPRVKSGMKGVEVRAAADGGFLKSKVHSLFIPEPILRTQEFRASLYQFAPQEHPLRSHPEGAA